MAANVEPQHKPDRPMQQTLVSHFFVRSPALKHALSRILGKTGCVLPGAEVPRSLRKRSSLMSTS